MVINMTCIMGNNLNKEIRNKLYRIRNEAERLLKEEP